MWPDRRLIDVLQIEHPILLSPMAGFGTVDLAAAVCNAGGLGSIGCAVMEPELAAKTIRALRGLTDKPINVNFFCHVQAKTATDREEAWRGRLLPYYRELGIDPEIPEPRVDLPSFDDTRCSIIEDTKPEVVSFHFGLPDSTLLARVKAVGSRIMASATTHQERVMRDCEAKRNMTNTGLEKRRPTNEEELPVVLLHGTSGQSEDWSQVVEQLTRHRPVTKLL